MSSNGFVHLHTHSHYSLLSSLGSPKHIAKQAKIGGMNALALTDIGNMHAAAEFYEKCTAEGIHPIIGVQAFLAPRSRHDTEIHDAKTSEITLLAKNTTGYKNLLSLTTEAYLTGLFVHPRIDWDLLQKFNEGIICLTGGRNGEIMQAICNGEKEGKITSLWKKYKTLFGENLYAEIQRHPSNQQLTEAEPHLLSWAEKMSVPLVATNDVHYLTREDAEAHDILLCCKNNAQKRDPGRITMLGGDYSLRSASEMRTLFSDLPEACDNTIKIAEQCHIEINFGEYLLPSFPLPENETNKSFLKQECEKGIKRRYGFFPKDASTQEQKDIVTRLNFELKTINDMGFPAYFLIVADFVQWAKEHDILVGPGRGSAAGSLVSYALTITNIDPLRYQLLFERFLNPERVSMPDIDIDFPDDRREEVLQYVRKKYGEEHVAQIATFGTMAARAAVKDVGRVLGLGFAEMNTFVKLIPEQPGITLDEAQETAPELREALSGNPQFQEIWNIAKKIEGTVRHVSVHACAVVISPDPLPQHTALQRAPKDENTIITQFSAKPIEKLGLLKMDFLGLKNLTILVRTLKNIEEMTGDVIDIENIDLENKKSFRLLSAGKTTGVFQLESAGMKRYLKELKPTNVEDIIAMVSLYRPGPMEWIPDYIDGKHGKKKVKYADESLEEVLKNTFGIAIYQEQILKIAQVFSGFSLGQADILRRAIGKKIASELASQREKFIDGAIAKGHEKKLAIQIFDEVIEPFAGYGFNKSHAAGYAMIAYQTAFLKANYPTAFMTALLTSDRDNTDRVIIDIEECRGLKIEVLPPDVNESNANFTAVEENIIRFGLGAIKGIGDSVVDSIVSTRQSGGRFLSFADFVTRCPTKSINKKSLEALAKSGALSHLEESNTILKHVKTITSFAKAVEKSNVDEQQHSLFAEDVLEGPTLTLEPEKSATKGQKLSWEQETLGMFVSGHPLQNATEFLKTKGTLINRLSMRKGKKTRIGGIVVGYRKIITKTKKQMAILFLEDSTGKTEVAVFPKTYDQVASVLQEAENFGMENVVLWIQGKAEKRQGEMQVIADTIIWQPLSEIEAEVEKSHSQDSGDEKEIPEKEDIKNIIEEEKRKREILKKEEREENKGKEEKREQTAEDRKQEGERKISHNPQKNTWYISLKNGASPHQLQKLNTLLRVASGNTPVVLQMNGYDIPTPLLVTRTPLLEAKIQEILEH